MKWMNRRDLLRLGAAGSSIAMMGRGTMAALAARPQQTFPADFLWGSATAAYQVEGTGAEDGRTP